MKKINWSKALIAVMLGTGFSSLSHAQDKVEASAGADMVSSYIWRGSSCGGISVQPNLSVSYKGLSLGAWGSVGFDSKDTKELDLILSYQIGGLNVAVTDYWFFPSDETLQVEYFQYAARNTQHVFEATIGYDFGVLGINWNTNFAGSDFYNTDDKRSFSTYVALTAPFTLGGLQWQAEVGITPWRGLYADQFNVTNVSLKALKELSITENFVIPIFAQLIVNPYVQRTHLVFGLTL